MAKQDSCGTLRIEAADGGGGGGGDPGPGPDPGPEPDPSDGFLPPIPGLDLNREQRQLAYGLGAGAVVLGVAAAASEEPPRRLPAVARLGVARSGTSQALSRGPNGGGS